MQRRYQKIRSSSGSSLSRELVFDRRSVGRYFKDTLTVTPEGFSVEVSFPEKAPGVRQRLHVALPAITVTLQPLVTDERDAPLAEKATAAPGQAP
ncbi:MAG: hypothetical protein SVO96_08955 [Pseudomonadota bacterium]|nr:hypothetical protein [Pseudomonadota bacterium]